MGRTVKISKYKPSSFQGRLTFSPVASMSFKAEHSIERTALKATCLLLALLACGYLYFVTSSVLHVMARREALAQIDAMQGSIGALEQQYFALSQDITRQSGASLGLSPVAKTDYVYRESTMGAVTMASHEI